jgi:H+-transporting ATPase
MADHSGSGAPALDVNFDEKAAQAPATSDPKKKVEEEEEEDEDIDALIEDLESQDGHEMVSSDCSL